MFQKKASVYIKTYCREISMTYANLLQEIQENEKENKDDELSAKRIKEKRLAEAKVSLKKLEDPIFNAFVVVS